MRVQVAYMYISIKPTLVIEQTGVALPIYFQGQVSGRVESNVTMCSHVHKTLVQRSK